MAFCCTINIKQLDKSSSGHCNKMAIRKMVGGFLNSALGC